MAVRSIADSESPKHVLSVSRSWSGSVSDVVECMMYASSGRLRAVLKLLSRMETSSREATANVRQTDHDGSQQDFAVSMVAQLIVPV